jgi:uncharacterized membrane protein
MMMQVLNYWAVLGAAVAAMVIGSLWYSPLLLGNPWMKLNNISAKDSKEMSKGMFSAMFGMFVGSLIMSYVLAYVLVLVGAVTISSALVAALWLWLGFIVVPYSSGVLFERRPVGLFFINIGYYLVGMLVMALILTAW